MGHPTKDGISLRSIDREYITPLLNQRNLLVGNASGGSTMTRMLSTNLPYSKVTFEGQMRGSTSEWLELVDMMENPDKSIDTNEALIRALGILYDIRSREDDVYEECISNIEDISEDKALDVITESVRDSDMRSELLELASYSAFLADYDEKRNYSLERMTAHRAADAKSGRLGDIEIYLDDEIEELWDAKFERELTCREWEKMEDICPNSSKGIITLKDQYSIEVPNSASVITLPDVLELDRTTSSAKDWLKEYVECLGKYNIDMVDFNHNTESVLDVISESTE